MQMQTRDRIPVENLVFLSVKRLSKLTSDDRYFAGLENRFIICQVYKGFLKKSKIPMKDDTVAEN